MKRIKWIFKWGSSFTSFLPLCATRRKIRDEVIKGSRQSREAATWYMVILLRRWLLLADTHRKSIWYRFAFKALVLRIYSNSSSGKYSCQSRGNWFIYSSTTASRGMKGNCKEDRITAMLRRAGESTLIGIILNKSRNLDWDPLRRGKRREIRWWNYGY